MDFDLDEADDALAERINKEVRQLANAWEECGQQQPAHVLLTREDAGSQTERPSVGRTVDAYRGFMKRQDRVNEIRPSAHLAAPAELRGVLMKAGFTRCVNGLEE